jgi:hypothetical protein
MVGRERSFLSDYMGREERSILTDYRGREEPSILTDYMGREDGRGEGSGGAFNFDRL